MGDLTLVLIMIPIIVAGVVCVYLAHRTITTQDAIIQSYQQRNNSEEQILDGLLTIIDEWLEYQCNDWGLIDQDGSTGHEVRCYVDGIDSARAIIEFYFEKLALGEKADLKELLERGKVHDKID